MNNLLVSTEILSLIWVLINFLIVKDGIFEKLIAPFILFELIYLLYNFNKQFHYVIILFIYFATLIYQSKLMFQDFLDYVLCMFLLHMYLFLKIAQVFNQDLTSYLNLDISQVYFEMYREYFE